MSEKFRAITEICSFALLPSCSEGIAGAVLTVMSAGIIPIVSRECGFEDDEVIPLRDCELETVKESIYYYGEMDLAWIKKESDRIRQLIKDRYSEKNYIQSVRSALQKVIG